MRRNERRAFFRGAIDIGGNKLPMPMQLLGRVGLVVNVDSDWFTFLEAEQRPRELAVVSSRGNDAFRRQFHRRHGDSQGVIGRADLAQRLLSAGAWRAVLQPTVWLSNEPPTSVPAVFTKLRREKRELGMMTC